MPRICKKRVTFLEKPNVSDKGGGSFSGQRHLPLLPTPAQPPNWTLPHTKTVNWTILPTCAPKQSLTFSWPPKHNSSSSLPPAQPPHPTWPVVPPTGPKQLQGVSGSPCRTSKAPAVASRVSWQRRRGPDEKRLPAAQSGSDYISGCCAHHAGLGFGAGDITTTHNSKHKGLTAKTEEGSFEDKTACLSLCLRSSSSHRREAALSAAEDDTEKARETTLELSRKVQYLKGQYEDRVRDVEGLLAAARAERQRAERELQETELQNAALRSFNAELSSLITSLRNCANPPNPRPAPERAAFLH